MKSFSVKNHVLSRLRALWKELENQRLDWKYSENLSRGHPSRLQFKKKKKKKSMLSQKHRTNQHNQMCMQLFYTLFGNDLTHLCLWI